MKARTFALPVLCLSLLLTAVAAQAQPGFLNTLLTVYPSHATALKQYGCRNCHTGNGGPRNAYGLAIEKAFKASGDDDLSADTIKQVESQSGSVGGPTFGSLINADQNPGAGAPAHAAASSSAPAAATSSTVATHSIKAAPAASSSHAAAKSASGKPAASVAATTAAKASTSSKSQPASAPAAKPAAGATSASAPAPAASSSSTAPVVSAPAAAPVASAPPAPPSPAPSTEDKSSALKPPPGVPEHAFHPAIVHFPIALFIAGLFLDIVGIIKKDDHFLYAGWFNLALAATSALAAVATGLGALIFMKMPLEGLLLQHMLLALLTTGLMWLMFGLRAYRHDNMKTPLRVVYFLLAILTFALISYVGHVGGQMVYGS